MSHIHILTIVGRIENRIDKTFRVLSSRQNRDVTCAGLRLCERTYKLQCGRDTIEVVIPEIRGEGSESAENYMILPEFLIPGRPYPVYVYLHAIALYSINPEMGQREAAERTRKHFGLATFSHTTLGRAIRKLEGLTKRFECEGQNDEKCNECIEGSNKIKFPSVEQMKSRKRVVVSYLKKAVTSWQSFKKLCEPQALHNHKRLPYKGGFIDACHSIVEYTFLNYQRLLL